MSDLGYEEDYETLSAWDRQYVWHPFTFLPAWLAEDFHPPVIVGGKGCYLTEAGGRELIDGNSSIWCNIHGHRHPVIEDAIRAQLDRFAHSSFLGFSHPPGIVLSRMLIEQYLGTWGFRRVFFSESGSNAIEVALRMAIQWQALNGRPEKHRIVAFDQSYHGDSLGAVSATGIPAFKRHLGSAGYPVVRVSDMDQLEASVGGRDIAALIVEPVVAGAAGMIPWPEGMLGRCREWCDRNQALLIHDEVLTGFGRTGKMFGFEHEGCPADILVLGKALSGGASPLSATITNQRVFESFSTVSTLEDSLLYGHSYAGHALGCAAGIASLEIFQEEKVLERLPASIEALRGVLDMLSRSEHVAAVRQRGFVSSVEVESAEAEAGADPYERSTGRAVAKECLRLGMITRSIGNSVVLLLPLCATPAIVEESGRILHAAIGAVFD